MNKIYKVIWSKVKNSYVVVPEIAASSSKNKGNKAYKSALAAVLTAMLGFGGFVGSEAATVNDGDTLNGSTHITVTKDPATKTITISTTGLATTGDLATLSTQVNTNTGNINNNATLTLLSETQYYYGNTLANGYFVSTVGNNQLKWETVEDWNVGVDMSFLNSRLGVTFEYFQKKSSNMLYQKQNIFAIGYPDWNSTVWMNIGSMKASGWELSLNWQDKVSDFSYNVGVNLSAVKNRAIKFSGDGPIQTGGFNSDQIIRNEDGGLISRFYGYVADGIFQNWSEVYAHTNEHGKLIQDKAQPGDIRFKDLNHDGVLDENDKTWIGNPYPDLMVGLNLGFNYKNFDFTANFYGTLGNDIFNKTK